MAENPLLPDEELRRLYRLLKQASRTPRQTAPASDTGAPPPSMAALITACAMQLLQSDVLLLPAALTLPMGLQKLWDELSLTISRVPVGISPLLAGASIASALQNRAENPLVLAVVDITQADNSWKAALQWAQDQNLPLIAALIDRSGPESMRRTRPSASSMGWTALDQFCRELHLPILTVDGNDAVASYRVMQESALRARAGGGPAILWAVLPPSQDSTNQAPLSLLARYMKVRRIPLR